MNRLLTGAILPAALLVWALVGSHAPDPDEAIAEAQSILEVRFADWRARVEGAAKRLVGLADEADPRVLFLGAETILEQEGVHGVAILDWENRARCWAGRTFQLNPEFDFYQVKQGVEAVEVLEHPAHRVLLAALPAGREIAVAFYAFDETFPQQRDLAQEVAKQTGLARIQLEYGERTVPVERDEPMDHVRRVAVIDGLVHATFHARSETALRHAAARASAGRWNTLLFVVLALAAWAGWHKLGRRLPRASLLRLLLAATLLAGGRALLSALQLPRWRHFQISSQIHPLWAGPGDILLSAAVALLVAILCTRTARHRRNRAAWALLVPATAFAFFAPLFYEQLLRLLVRREDGVALFDPLQVLPGSGAALLLIAVCFLTVALFLFCHAAYHWARSIHPLLGALPFAALALGALPWNGPVLAAGCMLAAVILRRAPTRPERAAALAFLTAVVSFPVLYAIQRDEFIRDVADRARELVSRRRQGEAEARLERAVQNATDPIKGAHAGAAEAIARGADPKHLAFSLWSASQWNRGDPCAVQVWDMRGTLLSTFDFDSPPTRLLPGPPRRKRLGPSRQVGRGEGEAIHFHAYDFELRTVGDKRAVGIARFLLPDRWDVLLSDLRPSMFSEPLDLLGRSAPHPLLLAELALDGEPLRTSDGTTASLRRPGRTVLKRAYKRGYAAQPITYRGQDALMVLTRSRYSIGALVFRESLLQQGGLAFAKILLTYSGVCLLYVSVLLLRRRGRVVFLFRHRIALFLALVAVAPVLLLGGYDRRVAAQRYETEIAERLKRRLDLAETLLRKEEGPITNEWCTAFAADYRMDINVYSGQDLVATSRPGVWDTGLLARRLAARPFLALRIEDRTDVTGREYFTRDSGLRASYRKVRRQPERKDLILAAPALDDRRDLERRAAESNALLLAIYLTTALVAVFVALYLARSLARPVRELREATQRVAAGDLAATLDEGRSDEFGDLVRAFNRMTREIGEAQELRVRVEKSAAWREMARQIAHEIKNPLTPIKLTVQNLLACYEDDPEAFRLDFETGAKLILDQIDALQRIAGDFSTYARFPKREEGPVDCNELIEDVAAFYTAAGGAPVATETSDGPLTIDADRDELRRALINLVTNSHQAAATKVILRAADATGAAIVSVHDDGVGINKADLARIWEPSFTTKSAGTGLGMPIVKRVVEDHGGTIEINSTPGRGTSVIIRLPLARG